MCNVHPYFIDDIHFQNLYFIFLAVLSDPMKRHIYDVYGKKGLDADWQVSGRNMGY